MQSGAVRWPVALIVSLGVHAGFAGLLLSISVTGEVEQQPVPKTRIEMAAHSIERVDAAASEPVGEAANEASADGASVNTGAIPMGRASEIASQGERTATIAAGAVEPDLISPRSDAVDQIGNVGAALATIPAAGPTATEMSPESVQPADVQVETEAVDSVEQSSEPSISLSPVSAPVRPEGLQSERASPVANDGKTVPGLTAKGTPLEGRQAVAEQVGEGSVDSQVVKPAAGNPSQAVALSANSEPVRLAEGTTARANSVRPEFTVPDEMKPSAAVVVALQEDNEVSQSAAITGVPINPVLASFETAQAVEDAPTQALTNSTVASATILPDASAATDQIRSQTLSPPDLPAASLDAPLAGESEGDPVQAASVAPTVEQSRTHVATGEPVAEQTAKTDALVARLAWSGEGDATVSAQSLAAIQSFLREGDIAQAAAVRDGIEGLLAQVPCSRIQAAFRPETGQLELLGHIPEDGLRAPVMEALQAQMGQDINVTDNLLVLPRPQCGALAGIASVGLPQSTDQLDNPLLVGPSAHALVYDFREGQRLTFGRSQAPDYDAFIYLDYFDAAGQVIHLAPNERVPLEKFRAKAAIAFGPESASGRILDVRIAPPYGQEIAVAFAASVPVYEGVRPLVEPAEPYLAFLTQKIAEARAKSPDFKGEWVYFFVSTRE